MLRGSLVLLVGIAIAACGGPSGQGDASALCDAVKGLAGNRADFQTFTSNTATLEEAVAAIGRVKDRTTGVIQRLDALASAEGPSADVARRFADNQRELQSVLGDFEKVMQTGSQADWTTARNRYADWYAEAQPMVEDAARAFDAQGQTCT